MVDFSRKGFDVSADPDPAARKLLVAACQAQGLAYAPFSQFLVGAAVQARDGRVFVGVNVENPSYSLTVCAERSAIAAAATAGVRPPDIVAVALAAPAAHVTPCGACRQVLAHWGAAGTSVWCTSSHSGHIAVHRIDELLPNAFDLVPA